MRKIIRELVKRSLFPCFGACAYAAVLGYHPETWIIVGTFLVAVRAKMRAEDIEAWERERG
jgi:hypothetical protein